MNIFNLIKNNVTIFDVVSEYTTLKKAGGTYWKARCPFHHEKTASFTISPDKEIFYCFGCHAGGDVITFIQKIENYSSPLEAVKYIAQRYNLELPSSYELSQLHDETKEKQHYFTLCKKVALWCHEQLKKSQPALAYLKQRGITNTSIDTFSLGYFPGGNQHLKLLLEYTKQQGILRQDLIHAHILEERRTTLYSPFEERILFPIQDHNGNYCGFGGRIFKPGDERPKYYNSRENSFFTKGTLLFGFDHAKKKIQQTGSIFLVEGYLDCIAMVQHQLPNTVATLGTACTLAHLKPLARYANYVYIVYDNDSAGQQAVIRLAQLCWQVNLELRVISLPPGHDPASFLAQGKSLAQAISTASDIFVFFINSLSIDFAQIPLQEKIQRTRKVLELIEPINDTLKQDFLLQEAAKAFDIPFTALKTELDRSTAPFESCSKKPSDEGYNNENESYRLEKKLFCAILSNIQENVNRIPKIIDYLPEPLHGILQRLKQMKDTHDTIDFIQFFDTLNNHEKQYISKLLLHNEENITLQECNELIYQLQRKQWRIHVRKIKEKIVRAKQEGNDAHVQKLLHEFLQLKKRIMGNNEST